MCGLLRGRLPNRLFKRFWWGNQTVTSQPPSYSDRRGKTVYILFNRPIFWLLDGQNRTRLKWASWYLRLSTPPECPSPFTRAITRTAINPLYFSCQLGDYLSHNLVSVQRPNSDLGFVRRLLRLEVSWLPTSRQLIKIFTLNDNRRYIRQTPTHLFSQAPLPLFS